MDGLRGTVRSGERIMLLGKIEGELEWRDAEHLALVLLGHAKQARQAQFTRERKCLDCGIQLEDGALRCAADCPGWKVRLPEEVQAA